MELKLELEVLSSVSIKRKKPWPSFAWLGEPPSSYGLFLLDDKRISQLSLGTGKTKRRISSLAPIQSQIALTTSSPSGAYLGGLTVTGSLFTWHKASEVLEVFRTPHGSTLRAASDKSAPLNQNFLGCRLFLSDSGEQALFVTSHCELYLWEVDRDGFSSWWRILPPGGVLLPQSSYREACVEACFFVDSVLGECCSCVFVFTSREAAQQTLITRLLIQWNNPVEQFYAAHSKIFPEDSCYGESTTGRIIPLSLDGSSAKSPILLQENAISGIKDTPISGKHASSLQQHQRGPDSRDEPLRDRVNVLETEQVPDSPGPEIESSHSHKFEEEPQTGQAPASTTDSGSGHSKEPRKVSSRDITDTPFQVIWRTITCCAEGKDIQHSSLTGRGSYVSKFSPTGNIMALAVNRNLAADTRVLFFSPLTECGLSSPVYQFRDKEKSGRTYWVSDLAWTADGLLLACMTRRGSLLMMPRFGRPLRLITRGCSLDMGPSLSLPLHPLITVIGAAAIPNVTNHETSQSSERDSLRQRFSVATHPHLPVLLCSDGYSVTVLKLESGGTLSKLVGGLVADARKKLGLPPLLADRVAEPGGSKEDSCAKQENEEGCHVKGGNRPRTPFKSLLSNELSCVVRGTDLDGTLASTFTASGTGLGLLMGLSGMEAGFTASGTGLGLLMGLSGMEAGAIHFAGVDSDLDQTNCSILGKTLQEKRSTERAVFELHTAWSLLLSAGELEPGNGLYPQEGPLTLREITACQASLEFSSSTLILTLASNAVAGAHAQDKKVSSSLVRLLSGTIDSVTSVLSLVALDSIKQGRLSLVVSLANVTCSVLLSECLKEHKSFLFRKRHNLKSLREFVESVTASITALGGFLSDVISLLDSTYSPSYLPSQPSLLAASFISPQPPDGQGSRLNAVAPLEASLSLVADVAKIFWKDIKSCSSAAKKILPRKATTNVLQLREFGLLYKSLVTSVKRASSVLQSTHASITAILQHLGAGRMATEEKQQLDIAAEELYLEGRLERALESFDQKQGHSTGKDGNPITSEQYDANTPQIDAVTPHLGHTVVNSLSVLFIKLEQYDLKSALEFAHSFIVNYQRKGALGQVLPPRRQARSATALPRSSSAMGVTGRAETGVGISRSRSWASLYQGRPVNSLPPSPCDLDSSAVHQLAESGSQLKTRICIGSDNGLAVVISLARFMTAFFCNRPLLIAPATNPLVLPPTSSPVPLANSRYLELDRSAITRSVRQQCLSNDWTADHTLELLLLSGLWEEACDLISSLGDWKKSFLLASTYLTHSKKLPAMTGNLQTESPNLEMASHQQAVRSIMSLLVSPRSTSTPNMGAPRRSQPVKHSETPKRPNRQARRTTERQASKAKYMGHGAEGIQPHAVEVLQSISRTLQACAWVELDHVLTSTVNSLLCDLTETCKEIPIEVPAPVYLPAPPLYCPQPSITQEEFMQCPGELSLRGKLAVLTRDLLAVLSASHCVQPCIQWYAHRLREVHAHPEAEELDCFAPPKRATSVSSARDNTRLSQWRAPEGFSFLQPDQDRAEELPFSIQFLLAAFRQLCSLLWLLHVRDQASLAIRKLHPSPPLRNPPRDACICEEAAIWCAKLLPFSEFLLKRKNDFKVEDLVLSVFLELPCSTFAADLLAYSFPGACFNQNRNLDAKMKRLLTRLRSTADVADSLADGGRGAAQSEPLSVRYQSTSQRILTTQESLGTKVGKFRVLISEASGSSSPGATLVESALEVGTFLHERDEDYASFCDTLFSVICPSEDTHRPSSSGRVSRQLVGETPPLPCLGHYCSMIANPDSSLTCWEQVLPLLTRLNDWSQSGTTSGSHPTIGRRPSLLLGNSWNSSKLSGLLGPSKKQKKAAAKRKLSESGGLQGSVMRVNLSPPFIINCLQVREENEVMKATKKATTCTPTRPPAGPASVPPSPSPFTRSSFTEHELSTNRSLHLADLEKSTADATVELGSQRGRIEATEQDVSRLGDQSTLGLKATEEDRGGSSGLLSLPLLQVPEGVLHGQLPTLAIKSLIEDEGSPVKARARPHSKKLPALEPRKVGDVDMGSPGPESSSPDPEQITESFSTGEVPSPVTFSIGEFGSRVRAEDTLTQTTDFGATLERLQQVPDIPTHDNSPATPAVLKEAVVTKKSPHTKRDSSSNDAGGSGAAADSNELGDTQPGGAESGGGGASEEQEGMSSRQERSGVGGEGGSGSDGDRSRSESDITEVTSDSAAEETHSSATSVPPSRQSPGSTTPASTSAERGDPDQEPTSKDTETATTKDPAAEKSLQHLGASPVHKQVAPAPPDPTSKPPPHPITATAATTTPMHPSPHPHFSVPPLPPSLAPPTRRGRHVSGTSMATTITTDFSDSPLPFHIQGETQPPAEAVGLPAPKSLPAPKGLPAAQESSVTTGSTEEEMRLLGYRNKLGPLQSTAIKGGHAVAGAPQRASALQMTLTSEETDKSGGMSARVGKRGREGPGESTMSGFHHLPEDPLREGGPCERDTVAPGGGRRDERREGEGQVVTRESIGKIVKHEMKKILKLQHEHLLGLLEATPTRDTEQLLQMEPTVPMRDQPGIGTQNSTHGDSMAPLLNLDDLQSTLVPDQPTHVTIMIPPTQSETNLEVEGQSDSELRVKEPANATLQTGDTNTKAGTEAKETTEDGPVGVHDSNPNRDKSHSPDLVLSDLVSVTHSPGAFLPLSSSNFSTTTTNGSVAVEPEKTRESRESCERNGPFSQIRFTGTCGQMPLLQIGALQSEALGGAGRARHTPLDLRQEYPDLAKHLTQFNNSVTQARVSFMIPRDSQVRGEPHSQAPPTQLRSAMPLLSVADLEPSKPPRFMQSYNYTMNPPPAHPKPLLLHLPSEADTLPGMVPPPEGPHTHKPAKREGHTFPTRTQTLYQQAPTSQSRPFPLLTLQSQVHQHQSNTPTHLLHRPPPSHPPPRQPPPQYKLPQVPIRPFIPRLIPPNVIQRQKQQSSDGFPLLKLEDPLSKMKQEGFKLLQWPQKPETRGPPKLLHVDPNHPNVLRPAAHLPVCLPSTVDSGTHQAEAELNTKMAEDVMTVESAEKDDRVTAAKESGSGGDTVQEKRQTRVRRRRRRERHVSWKGDRDSEDPEEPIKTGARVRSKPSEKQLHKEPKPESQPDHDTEPILTSVEPPGSEPSSSHAKDISSPGIQSAAPKHRQLPEFPSAKPGAKPLERLELRRLELNASYLPSTSSGEDQEPPRPSQAVPRELDRAVQVSPDGVGVDRAVQVELPVFGSEATDVGRPYPTVDAERIEHLLRPKAAKGGHQYISVVDIWDDSLASPIPEPESAPTLPATLESDLKPGSTKPEGDADQGHHKGRPSYDEDSEPPSHLSSVPTAASLSPARDDIDALPPPTVQDIVGPAPPELGALVGRGTAVPAADKVTEKLLNAVPSQNSQATSLPSVLHPPLALALGGHVSSLTQGYSRSGALERLCLLEEQLSAVESTAQAVEGEFRDSNQLLHTIDQLQAVSETQIATRPQQLPELPEESSNIETTPHITPPTTPPSTPQTAPHTTPTKNPPEGPLELAINAQAHDHAVHKVFHHSAEDPGGKLKLLSLPVSQEELLQSDQEEFQSMGETAIGETNAEQRPRSHSPAERHEVATLPHVQLQGDPTQAAEADTGLGDTGDARDGATEASAVVLPVGEVAMPEPSATEDRSLGMPPPSAGMTSPPEQKRKMKGHVQFKERLTKGKGSQIVSKKPQEGAGSQPKRDREEVRKWMAAKRRERQAGFAAHRPGLRSAQKGPAQPPPQSSLAKLRGERRNQRREQEKEARAKRIQEAFSLMNDILTSKPEKTKASGTPSLKSPLPPPARSPSSTHLTASPSSRTRPPVEFASGRIHKQVAVPAAARLPPSGRKLAGNSSAESRRSRTRFSVPGSFKEAQEGPRVRSSTETNAGLASGRSSLKGTHSISSPGTGSGRVRKISSVEGLTEDEQEKIANILASTECDQHSLSSGSVASSINWEEVDRILEN